MNFSRVKKNNETVIALTMASGINFLFHFTFKSYGPKF